MKKNSKVGYGAPPKPIVFIPPFFGKSFTVEENGFLDVGILLFGRFTRYLPHVALGLSMLGQSGIGSERRYDVNKFKLEEMRCSTAVKSSHVHFHNVKSRSLRAGKRDFHTYTGTAEYSIEKIDENAIRLIRIGLLIGAGPKPSFGLGFLRMIDSNH